MASSSSNVRKPPQHQVFINFRGEELRCNFVSHLENALKRDGINVFIDKDELKGKDLNVLFQRIEESRIALAIFSSRYAESYWCLDELVKIKERVEEDKLVVIPIFYKVKTEDVKTPDGEFGDKFFNLVKSKDDRMKEWKEALDFVTRKIGCTLEEKSYEGAFVNKIVEEVMRVLSDISADETANPPLSPSTGEGPETTDEMPPLFGIKTRLRQLGEKLDFECESTRTVGVVGMPGIGKTTLVKQLCEEWRHKFRYCVLFPDIRKMRIDQLDQNRLLEELITGGNLNQEVPEIPQEPLKAHLLERKVLVVLDDVSDKQQIEVLLGERDWIKEGSRIVITTRDKSLVQSLVDDTYVVPRLNDRDGLRYFSCHAFGDNIYSPSRNFLNLSREFVDCAKGNPLALKVLGLDLRSKDETQWRWKLETLAQSPNPTIQDFFRISYNELSELQKDAFLDIACFFRSEDEYYVRSLLDSCDPESGEADKSQIRDLADKFLINISGGRVEMHDLLYTFGKELGSQGQRRLWNHREVVGALMKRTGTGSVRGIFLDMSEVKQKMSVDTEAFRLMVNLRYLKIYNSHCNQDCEADCKLNFPDKLKYFPLSEVRYLHWLKFPLEKLPSDFNPENLIDLKLPYSKIKNVWDGVKNTSKLKWVDLKHSRNLCKLSGLLEAQNLQRLNLEGCTSLDTLPKEMENMKSLIFLNLRGCTSLRSVPHMKLISLKTLILSGCSGLTEFQLISENLEAVYLEGTAIEGLPQAITKSQKLVLLNLKDCKMLVTLPDSLSHLRSLEELILSGCLKLESFPDVTKNLKCLKILLLDGTSIKDMPDILQFNRSEGQGLRESPRAITGLSLLRRLSFSRNDMIRSLQANITQLYHLKWLDLKYCKNLAFLPLLPPSLECLDAHGCGKLKTVASSLAHLMLTELIHSTFIFTNCNNLEQVSKDSITSYAQRKSQLMSDALNRYNGGFVSEALFHTCFPGSEVPSEFSHQAVGSVLNARLPPHWCDYRLTAIALCAVISFQNHGDQINRFSVECTCVFKNEDGSCISFNCTVGGWTEPDDEPRKIESDHVFIGYNSCSHTTKCLEKQYCSKCIPTEASLEFRVTDGTREIEGCEVLKCGLSLVYAEPNNVPEEPNDCGTPRYRSWSLLDRFIVRR